jgi:peroxiredoxin
MTSSLESGWMNVETPDATEVAYTVWLHWIPVDAAPYKYHNVDHMRQLMVLFCVVPLFMLAETERKNAPDFARVDATGHMVHLSNYKGKVVLLDFWATWCTGCKQEIPWYVEFADKYKKDGLAAVGVAMDDEGWKVVKPFLAEKMQIPYPVVIGDKALAREYGGIDNLPVTLLIDRQGRVAYSHVGVVNRAKFEGEIRELLASAR